MSSWAHTRDAFRTRLWPIPTIAVVAALVLGLVVPEIDAAYDDAMSAGLSSWLFGGDADAARSLLGSISSSLITVTGLTFSLTVVSLQLASSQFSPRLLRTFTRDLFVQVTLALFLATFTYSLTVLRAVRGSDDGGGAQLVPKLAVTLAFVLAIASVLGLVLFLSHLTKQLRVETMLSHVHRDALATMRSVRPPRDRRDGDEQGERDGGPVTSDDARTPDPPSHARTLVAADDGFLTGIDHDALRSLAVEEGAVLELDVDAGTFLVHGTPLGRAWALDDGGDLDRALRPDSREDHGCIDVGVERTSAQDVGFGLRQLTDVANKALSPGDQRPDHGDARPGPRLGPPVRAERARSRRRGAARRGRQGQGRAPSRGPRQLRRPRDLAAAEVRRRRSAGPGEDLPGAARPRPSRCPRAADRWSATSCNACEPRWRRRRSTRPSGRVWTPSAARSRTSSA